MLVVGLDAYCQFGNKIQIGFLVIREHIVQHGYIFIPIRFLGVSFWQIIYGPIVQLRRF